MISATAFISAFNELDVPRSSGAVSGRLRTGCAARVLIVSVLVTCRGLAVVRVLGSRPRLLGGGAPSFGLFSVDFGCAQHSLRGRGVFGGGTCQSQYSHRESIQTANT